MDDRRAYRSFLVAAACISVGCALEFQDPTVPYDSDGPFSATTRHLESVLIGSPPEPKYHLGVDLNQPADADCGDALRAIANGTIRWIDDTSDMNSFGRILVLHHQIPDGREFDSVYYHLQSIDSATLERGIGGRVSKGQVVGTVGNANGYYVPPDSNCHLHFEILRSPGWPAKFPGGFPLASDSIVGQQARSAAGTIAEGPRYSGGYRWWRIDFDSGYDGWVAGSFLTGPHRVGGRVAVRVDEVHVRTEPGVALYGGMNPYFRVANGIPVAAARRSIDPLLFINDWMETLETPLVEGAWMPTRHGTEVIPLSMVFASTPRGLIPAREAALAGFLDKTVYENGPPGTGYPIDLTTAFYLSYNVGYFWRALTPSVRLHIVKLKWGDGGYTPSTFTVRRAIQDMIAVAHEDGRFTTIFPDIDQQPTLYVSGYWLSTMNAIANDRSGKRVDVEMQQRSVRVISGRIPGPKGQPWNRWVRFEDPDTGAWTPWQMMPIDPWE